VYICAANLEIPSFYETPQFITVFAKSGHKTLSWGKYIQFTSLHLLS